MGAAAPRTSARVEREGTGIRPVLGAQAGFVPGSLLRCLTAGVISVVLSLLVLPVMQVLRSGSSTQPTIRRRPAARATPAIAPPAR